MDEAVISVLRRLTDIREEEKKTVEDVQIHRGRFESQLKTERKAAVSEWLREGVSE